MEGRKNRRESKTQTLDFSILMVAWKTGAIQAKHAMVESQSIKQEKDETNHLVTLMNVFNWNF